MDERNISGCIFAVYTNNKAVNIKHSLKLVLSNVVNYFLEQIQWRVFIVIARELLLYSLYENWTL